MLTRTLTAERDRRSPRGMPNIGIGGQSAIFARAAAKQWNGHARASVGDLPRDGQRCRASPGCAGERTGCTHVGSSPIPIATGAEANCTYHVYAHLADFFSCVCLALLSIRGSFGRPIVLVFCPQGAKRLGAVDLRDSRNDPICVRMHGTRGRNSSGNTPQICAIPMSLEIPTA